MATTKIKKKSMTCQDSDPKRSQHDLKPAFHFSPCRVLFLAWTESHPTPAASASRKKLLKPSCLALICKVRTKSSALPGLTMIMHTTKQCSNFNENVQPPKKRLPPKKYVLSVFSRLEGLGSKSFLLNFIHKKNQEQWLPLSRHCRPQSFSTYMGYGA